MLLCNAVHLSRARCRYVNAYSHVIHMFVREETRRDPWAVLGCQEREENGLGCGSTGGKAD